MDKQNEALLEGVEMPEAHQLFTERCGHFVVTADQLRETVAAAVLREREACAKAVEAIAWANTSWTKASVTDCAAAIRNRSEAMNPPDKSPI